MEFFGKNFTVSKMKTLWLRQRYALLNNGEGEGTFLIGYKNLFAKALKELKDKETDELLNKFENDYKEMQPQLPDFKEKLKSINGAVLKDKINLSYYEKDCYMNARIYGQMYNYKISNKIYYMCLRGMPFEDWSKVGKDNDQLLETVGPFGRGCYLSE